MTTRTSNGLKSRARYFELVRLCPLLPIRSEGALDRALEMIDSLIDQKRLDSDEQGYLDILSDLVESYEEKHHPIPPPSDAALLQHLIEARGATQAEVSRATGIAVSTLSEILSGKRTLPRFKIGRLANYFHVSPAVFAFEK